MSKNIKINKRFSWGNSIKKEKLYCVSLALGTYLYMNVEKYL